MLSQQQLKSLLEYDQETGFLYWKPRPESMFKTKRACSIWHKRFCGKKAGGVCVMTRGKKYVQLSILNKRYYAHRVAWIIANGNINFEIDHINGDGTDNRICNLRDVDHLSNCRNMNMKSNNTSGATGVRFESGKWKASISVLGKNIYLGRFDTRKGAIKARKDSLNNYGFHDKHGLMPGERGHKDYNQDCEEAIQSIRRSIDEHV